MTVGPVSGGIMLPPTRRLTARLTSRVAWACLAAAAVALLAIGSIHPPPTTAAARIARLDSIIRCPSCEDLSLTQSDAASSVTLRREVASWVRQGWSDNRIEQAVVARYGEAGLLLPQSSGAAAALYIVPLAIVGAAAGGVGLFLWRRRRGDDAVRRAGGGRAL
jgi:cytochrome c-type biogenesis protein CcmH